MFRTFALLTPLAILPFTSLSAELTVEIHGLKNDHGRVMVAIYDSADRFLKSGKEVAASSLVATGKTMQVRFVDLKPGQYAAAIFHDEDGDGKLARNLLGVPTEGIAFSEDATATFGPPKFDDAVVELADGERKTTRSTLGY